MCLAVMCSSLSIAAAPTLLKQASVYQHQLKSIDIANIKHPGKPSSAFLNEPTIMKSQFETVCLVFTIPRSHQGLPSGYLRLHQFEGNSFAPLLVNNAHTKSNSGFNFLLGLFCIFFKTTCCKQHCRDAQVAVCSTASFINSSSAPGCRLTSICRGHRYPVGYSKHLLQRPLCF